MEKYSVFPIEMYLQWLENRPSNSFSIKCSKLAGSVSEKVSIAKGLAKPIKHFIQHNKNAMLDEMLDRVNRTER